MEAMAILAGRWNREAKMFISFCVIDTILLVRSHSIDEIVSEIRVGKASRLTFFWDDPIDTENGGEFLNETLIAYCEREELTFTRGRPYVKNDQCFVEQKNGAIVRKAGRL